MDSDQDGATANDDVTPEAVIDSDDDVTFPLSYELFNWPPHKQTTLMGRQGLQSATASSER